MITVLTDTVANIDFSEARKNGIEILPVYVTFGAETYRDEFDLTSTEFFERLIRSDALPTTTQPSVHDFEQTYTRIAERDPDGTILSIHMTGALSGTVESARGAAARLPDLDIRIFDTRGITLAQGLMVMEAARMAVGGASIDTILAKLDHMRENMQLFMAMDTLDYLAKGGRIGRAARLLGTLLDMKPILRIVEGAVDPYDRQRSRAAALKTLQDLVLDDARGAENLHLGVVHSMAENEARMFAAELRAKLHIKYEMFAQIGPALGTYSGPGAIGIAWYVDDEPSR